MATPNEQILYAAKTDSLELMNEVLTGHPPDEFDLNYQDGLGNCALHYAVMGPAPSVLELLLETEGTDVDLQNRLDQATPLHLAIKIENPDARLGVIELLLEAGADPRIKDKHGLVPAEYLTNVEEGGVDKEIQRALAIATAEFVIGGNRDDVASDDEKDGKGGSGSGSGSGSE